MGCGSMRPTLAFQVSKTSSSPGGRRRERPDRPGASHASGSESPIQRVKNSTNANSSNYNAGNFDTRFDDALTQKSPTPETRNPLVSSEGVGWGSWKLLLLPEKFLSWKLLP